MDSNYKNNTTLLKALQRIQGAGCYHVEDKIPFLFPGIGLKSGEELAFPLSRSQAEAIKAEAEAAPYGKGSATVHDETVRKCWQIDAGDLDWSNPEWPRAIAGIARKAAKGLGVKGKVVAEPYKLLLYEKGGFFLPHRDTEKIPAMFATLIVNLPSSHEGGQLVIRHDERVETIDFGGENPKGEIRFAAFFADCEHEILPVTKGVRLCLAYNLAIGKGQKSIPNPAPSGDANLLFPGMEQLAADHGDDLSAILLDHRYTQANLTVSGLKGDDRARAKALFDAAKNTGLAARLALVSLYRMGELEGGYADFGYHRGGLGSDDDEDGEMGEIYDESLTVDEWRSPGGRVEKLGCFPIDESQIISAQELADAEPDEKFAEGFTGNAGCTMEHWYHRAAIVLWPKDKEAQILARYNFPGTCLRFEKLVAKKNSPTPKTIELGSALIEEGKRRLEETSEHLFIELAQSSLPIITSIAKIRSETLFALCQGSFLSNVLTVADSSVWKQLLDAFGGDAVDAFLKETTRETMEFRRNSLFGALSAALVGKHFQREIASSIANRLMDLFSNLPPDEPHSFRRPAQLSRQTQHFHVAIAASFLISNPPDRDRLRRFLWSGGGLPHLRSLLGPALLVNTHRNHLSAPGSLSVRLLSDSIDVLRAEAQTPVQPYSDWSRPVPEADEAIPWHCDQALIDELKVFMKDAGSEEYRFRKRQQHRTALENYIERHQLDIDFSTDKRGTPHTLVCRKNNQSYQALVKQRSNDEKLLKKLLALREKISP